MISYSFIIPHKNCPDLLQRCLDSIPRRKDIQIIIVDDNSSPENVDFAKFPGNHDPCVEIIYTKEGKGAGYARNVGLKKATGKWILFADSDDFYNIGLLDVLDEYAHSEWDVIIFTVNSVDSDTLGSSLRKRIISNESVLKYDASDPATDNLIRYKNYAPWNKIISKKLIDENNIRFDEIPVNNDVFFSFKLGKVLKNYMVVRKDLYCLTYRKDSISRKKSSFEEEFQFLKMRIRIREFHKSVGCKRISHSVIAPVLSTIKKYNYFFFFRYLFFLLKNRRRMKFVKNHWQDYSCVFQ
jgi:glycosyltransferase involved in cell wall biosynthesis